MPSLYLLARPALALLLSFGIALGPSADAQTVFSYCYDNVNVNVAPPPTSNPARYIVLYTQRMSTHSKHDDAIQAYIDAVDEQNRKVILDVGATILEENWAALERVVKRFKDDSGVYGFYLADEPLLNPTNNSSLSNIRRGANIVREVTGKPIFMAFAMRGEMNDADVRPYLDECDVVLTHNYQWKYGDNSLKRAPFYRQEFDDIKDNIQNVKRLWITGSFQDVGKNRFPTSDELAFQLWYPILQNRNVEGVGYYGWHKARPSDKFWPAFNGALKPVVNQISQTGWNKLGTAINNRRNPSGANAYNSNVLAVKYYGNSTKPAYVVLVNKSKNPQSNVSIWVKGNLSKVTRVNPGGSDIDLDKNNRFTADFKPHEVHIYRLIN